MSSHFGYVLFCRFLSSCGRGGKLKIVDQLLFF
jgi:hypothetical protein